MNCQQELVVKVALTQGQMAIVDAKYSDSVNRYKWYAEWHPTTHSYRAARNDSSGTRRKHMFMSRFVYELVNGSTSGELVIDHINGDTLDNRIDNLRAVTHRKNSQNRRDQREEKTSSKYVGVYWHKQGHKWMSRIRINGFQKYIGLFDSEENARDAYQRALKETQ